MRPGETPVPIPNTTVKAWAADGTTLETAWESRRAPDQKKRADEGSCVLMTDKRYQSAHLENCIHVHLNQ